MTNVARVAAKKILYRQSNLPVLQNRLYRTVEEARNCPKGDLEIVQDLQTGLVYNAAFSSELMSYDIDYNSNQGISERFCTHLQEVAQLIEDSLGREDLVEVGCGKGFFLEMLLERGIDITGFDPTYDGENPRIQKKYFEPGLLSVPVKGFILRHVLEHIPNPIDFLFQLKKANGGGLVFIEVPCFDRICEKKAWFDIFYEHVNYFRLSDFASMFEGIVKSGRFFGDHYIYVIADLSTLREPVFQPCNAVDFPSDFLSHLESGERGGVGEVVSVWGGASKGCIFSLLRERAGFPVDMVIDANPEKQGNFLPGTGLEVFSPEMALKDLPKGSKIFVMNANYLEEIKTMSKNLFNYAGVE